MTMIYNVRNVCRAIINHPPDHHKCVVFQPSKMGGLLLILLLYPHYVFQSFQVAILHSVPVTHLVGNRWQQTTPSEATLEHTWHGSMDALCINLDNLCGNLSGNLCGIPFLMASDKNHWLFRNTRRHCARPLTAIPVLQEVPGISLSRTASAIT